MASPHHRPRRSPTPTALMSGTSAKPSSPDPIKDAILSASGTGWSPLRIAKRESPSPTPAPAPAPVQQPPGKKQGLGRRQSSSYNHVRNSHLVSNSPFKSDGSAPIGARFRPSPSYKGLDVLRRPGHTPGATGRKVSGNGEQRRVSAERRAKSYENDRPGQFTPRRASKGQQKGQQDGPSSQQRSVLAERKAVVEPLTPELTDNGADKDDNAAMDVDIGPILDLPRPATPPRHAAPDSLHGKNPKPIPGLSPAPELPVSRIPVPSNSPTKSSLVSKRLLGPRSISNSSNESAKRRRRRKTVTFDPRCDVVEFSADEMSEDDDYDDYGDDNEDDTDYMDTDEHEHPDDMNSNRQGDLDGFVESILAQDMPRSPQLLTSDTEATPDISADTEDGVPYGRSHHADRVLQHRQSVMKALEQSPSADMSLDSADTETENGVPYGRSHHAERARQAHEEERQADALPGSPSPGRTLRESHYSERLLPPVELPVPAPEERAYALDEDPFSAPSTSDFGVAAFGLNETGGTYRSPRISREEVMRRLQTRRTGVIDSDSVSRDRDHSQTPTGSPAHVATPGSTRAATPGSARRHDKPLPIAPGPPMISVPGLNFEGDVSLSDSLNFDLPRSDEGHGAQEMDVSLPQDDEGPQSAIIHQSALDELLRGVEREMEVERARSPDVASSIGTGTPALDAQYATTEAEETDVPATPADLDLTANADTRDKAPSLLSGAFTDSRDVSSSVEMDVDTPDVPQLLTPELAHKPSLHAEPDPHSTNDGLLAIPEPADWITQGGRVNKSSNGSVRSEASSVRSGESQIAKRAASIRAKKREKRESEGRARPRRSMSVADAENLVLEPQSPVLPSPVPADEVIGPSAVDIPLSESIDNELRRRMPPGADGRKYRMREASSIVYAADKVVHAGAAGDVDAGRAWKTVRRPSDMNEYARQIREMRNADKTGKAYGKVFVRVVGIKGLAVPVPGQPTFFTCTLNNGIHFVTTPECKLAKDCKVDQEFELIEHSKLEFTLTIKVRRDAHLLPPPAPRPAPPPPVPTASHSKVSGMLAFFGGGSPKKARAGKERSGSPAPVQAPPPPQPEGLARYLKSDGTLARVFINFADIASRCDTKLFETGFKMVGAKPGGEAVVLGELVLQVFRLPALPGVPSADLPQSLEECHRGLRHVNWHKQTYFEGILTQIGGDCKSWRRRQFRVVGGSLVAYNDVTKKITAKIDLKHAVSIHDDDADAAALDRRRDSADALFQIERSFRIKFGPSEEICFYADSELEKEQWLEVLKALVGHIPPNPLWAEMVWQRQQETQQPTSAGRSR